jgi:hypothetical protein
MTNYIEQMTAWARAVLGKEEMSDKTKDRVTRWGGALVGGLTGANVGKLVGSFYRPAPIAPGTLSSSPLMRQIAGQKQMTSMSGIKGTGPGITPSSMNRVVNYLDKAGTTGVNTASAAVPGAAQLAGGMGGAMLGYKIGDELSEKRKKGSFTAAKEPMGGTSARDIEWKNK